jgi:hypothetical protein
MMNRYFRVLLVAALACCTQFAQAEAQPKFQFTGTVTYGSYLALEGAKVTGTFAYNIETMSPRKQIALHGNPGVNLVEYGMGSPAGMTAQVGAHTITATGLMVAVHDGLASNFEDMVTISGGHIPSAGPGGIVLDGTTYSQGVLSLTLATAAGNTHVLRDSSLPQAYNVKAFEGATVGMVRDGSVENLVLLIFKIDRIQRKN